MLDQQAETVRGDHMSLLRGGGGRGGGEDGFPFKAAVHADRRQPERRKRFERRSKAKGEANGEQRRERLNTGDHRKSMHGSMLRLVPTARGELARPRTKHGQSSNHSPETGRNKRNAECLLKGEFTAPMSAVVPRPS